MYRIINLSETKNPIRINRHAPYEDLIIEDYVDIPVGEFKTITRQIQYFVNIKKVKVEYIADDQTAPPPTSPDSVPDPTADVPQVDPGGYTEEQLKVMKMEDLRIIANEMGLTPARTKPLQIEEILEAQTKAPIKPEPTEPIDPPEPEVVIEGDPDENDPNHIPDPVTPIPDPDENDTPATPQRSE